jgi:DNA-binding transcriptional LysR family regulator
LRTIRRSWNSCPSPSYLWLRREAGPLNAVLRARIQVRGFDAMCRMVEAGLGIGMVPLRAARGFAKSMAIQPVALREPWARRRFCVIYRAGEALAHTERSFVDFVEREWMRTRSPSRGQTRVSAA